MDLKKYERRLGSKSLADAFMKDTSSIINDEFSKAPSYRSIKLNGVDEECIFKLTKQSNKLEIFLRPSKSLDKGMYVLLDGKTYMVTEYVPNEIYPKGAIELCNNTLRWRDTFNSLKEYNCIVKGNSVSLDDSDKYVITSDAELVILVQYNSDTSLIKPSHRFIFGEYAYEVKTVDNISSVFDQKGYIKLTVKSTGVSTTDDTTGGVADSSGNSDWSGW